MGRPSAPARSIEDEACTLAEDGDFAAATAKFRQAIAADPARVALHEQLAQCLLEDGDVQAAHDAAMHAAELSPQELGGAEAGLAAERAEAERRAAAALAARIGLPQLLLSQDTGSGAGPAGLVWECGVALAEYLVRHCGPGALSGKRVLELGSGTGVAGLAAALLGAQVTLTDLPGALPLLRRNAAAAAAAIAAAGGSATVAELDWAGVPGWQPSSWPAPPAAAAPTAGAEQALSCRCAAEDGAGADRARRRPAQAHPCAERPAESACGWAGAAAPAASCQPSRRSGCAPDDAPIAPCAPDASDAQAHASSCCGRISNGIWEGPGRAAEAPARPGAPAAEAAGQAHAASCCGRVGSGVREGQGQAAEAPAHPGAPAEGAALCNARYDLLLGADLVYTAAAVAPLANAVARALRAPSGGRRGAAAAGACGVLLAHKDRHAHVTAGLMRALEALGLRLDPVGVSVRSPAVRVYAAPAPAHAPDAGTAGGV